MMVPASLFTDGVILSRRKEIRIFGEASRGAEVRVRLHDPAGYLLAEGLTDAGKRTGGLSSAWPRRRRGPAAR